eukprot:CAMPEP_0172446492 /NCGR_PEP_ID=MMETSP1065-20121228/6076_1 /TAXON_ID=265537 /ORGANISM="Amphiprora paludosa, Strain CCMP125" /LENGTH=186 /DNA_ID=CAMNT_0013197621 /DNA_START=97 /DNA_END=657 /DNA_ORIENTATION=+
MSPTPETSSATATAEEAKGPLSSEERAPEEGTNKEAEAKKEPTPTEGEDETKRKLEDNKEKEESPPKKAKIAAPFAGLVDDGKPYKLDSAPTENNQDNLSKIETPAMVLFGLFPSVTEEKLKPFLEQYGPLKECRVRRAFANVYAAIEYETLDQAKEAFQALNSASLLGKTLMIQPQKAKTAEVAS